MPIRYFLLISSNQLTSATKCSVAIASFMLRHWDRQCSGFHAQYPLSGSTYAMVDLVTGPFTNFPRLPWPAVTAGRNAPRTSVERPARGVPPLENEPDHTGHTGAERRWLSRCLLEALRVTQLQRRGGANHYGRRPTLGGSSAATVNLRGSCTSSEET